MVVNSERKQVELKEYKNFPRVIIDSPQVLAKDNKLLVTEYEHQKPMVSSISDGIMKIINGDKVKYQLKTDLEKPKKLGLMLVGWGGNNGSTLTASLLALKNKLRWESRNGEQEANYFGSVIMASCTQVGVDNKGNDVHLPLFQLAPFTDPMDIEVSGWDISKVSIGEAIDRAKVLEPSLKAKLKPLLKDKVPLPSYYDPSFIASNQKDRADNVIKGSKKEILEKLRKDIRDFKQRVDKVVVMWTANTERYTVLDDKVHYKANDLMKAIDSDFKEISPSTLFAVASIMEGCLFINGSPQNTLIPAVVELAKNNKVSVAGDDFKSGQTKFKSVLVDFLVSAGIKPHSIVSYNHLGNNDGKNLAEAAQFKSKEISKSSVCDDIYSSNPLMFPNNKKPNVDHTIVIEYVPAVGDSKRAMDEYECEIFMGGRQTFSIHNVCEDSLLAAPLMLDLVLLGELLTRVEIKKDGCEWQKFDTCLSLLSFMLKAPMVPKNAPVINALGKQRRAIEIMIKAIAGLPVIDDLDLPTRI